MLLVTLAKQWHADWIVERQHTRSALLLALLLPLAIAVQSQAPSEATTQVEPSSPVEGVPESVTDGNPATIVSAPASALLPEMIGGGAGALAGIVGLGISASVASQLNNGTEEGGQRASAAMLLCVGLPGVSAGAGVMLGHGLVVEELAWGPAAVSALTSSLGLVGGAVAGYGVAVATDNGGLAGGGFLLLGALGGTIAGGAAGPALYAAVSGALTDEAADSSAE